MAKWVHIYGNTYRIHDTKKEALKHKRKKGGKIRKLKKDDNLNEILRTTLGVGFGLAALKLVS